MFRTQKKMHIPGLAVVALILLAALSAVFLASCQQEEKKPVTLEFWHAFGDEARSGWIQSVADAWNAAHPGFVLVPSKKGSYRETLQAATLAARQGNGPHLVQLFEVGSQLAVDSGIFQPVQTVKQFDSSDYIAPVLNYYTIGGQINSLPFNSSSPILYTNRDLMAKAGLNPDQPPKTFSELMVALEKGKAAGVDGSVLSFCLHSWYFEQWMSEQNAPLVNNDNGRSARATETLIDSPAGMTIATWFKELNDKGFYVYTGKLEDWDGNDAIFTEGKAMFHITSTADLGNIAKACEGKFAMGTGLLPIPDGVERNGTVIGGASVWLSKGKPQTEAEAALDFVLFMTNTENMISWHKLTGYYPVRNSSVKQLEAEKWFSDNPTRTIAFTQLLETRPNIASAGALMGSFTDTRTIIEEALQKIIGGADVAESIHEAKRLADEKLKEYNASVSQ